MSHTACTHNSYILRHDTFSAEDDLKLKAYANNCIFTHKCTCLKAHEYLILFRSHNRTCHGCFCIVKRQKNCSLGFKRGTSQNELLMWGTDDTDLLLLIHIARSQSSPIDLTFIFSSTADPAFCRSRCKRHPYWVWGYVSLWRRAEDSSVKISPSLQV